MRDALFTARTARYQIVEILTGAAERTSTVVAAVAALVAAKSLAACVASTFGVYNNLHGSSDCSIALGSKTLNSPRDLPWSAADVGKDITVQGAGAAAAPLVTTIAGFTSAGVITLTDAAASAVTSTATSASGIALWGNSVNNVLDADPLLSGGSVLETLDGRIYGTLADGTTDDTQAINNALRAADLVVDGGGHSYIVTTVIVPSGKTLRNINLVSLATAAEVYLRPVVKIGDDVTAVSNITLENVKINGNRSNLDNISMAHGEDGGMHGIRVGGLSTDIRIINCEASYCGTAGLAIHDESAGAAATYPIQRVYVENFVGRYNREHGMFADSFDGVFISGAVLNYNGLTLVGGQPDTSGKTGAKAGGVLFGAGFDLETYVGFASSYIKNFVGVGIVCKGNAQGSLMYIPSVVDAVAEIPAQNIIFHACDWDKSTLGVNVYGFKIVANSAVGAKYGVDGVTITGRMNGYLDANNVKGLNFDAGWIESTLAYKALINNSVDFSVVCESNVDNVKVETFGAVGVVATNGAGTWTPGILTAVLANGKHVVQIDGNVTGGTIVGGAMAFTVTMPTGVKGVTDAVVNAYNTTSFVSAVANVRVVNSTTLVVYITPIDDTVSVQLRCGVIL